MPPATSSPSSGGTESAVKVLGRVRPFSKSELAGGLTEPTVDVRANSIILGEKTFTFEMAFSGIQHKEQRPKQEDIYAHVGPSLIECATSGYNAALFAYGQTGSGKTHTMMGPSAPLELKAPQVLSPIKKLASSATPSKRPAPSASASPSLDIDLSDPEQIGLIPRFITDAFAAIRRHETEEDAAYAKEKAERRAKRKAAQQSGEEVAEEPLVRYATTFRVTARYFEVYCERAYDLLNCGQEVRVRDGERIDGIVEDVVTSPESVLDIIKRGNSARTTAATLKNERSSRSHAVFQLKFHKSRLPVANVSSDDEEEEDVDEEDDEEEVHTATDDDEAMATPARSVLVHRASGDEDEDASSFGRLPRDALRASFQSPLPPAQFRRPEAHQDPSPKQPKVSSPEGRERRPSSKPTSARKPSAASAARVIAATQAALRAKPEILVSTISLVDLAGSERQKQSGAVGKQLKEMVNINLSLMTLRRVIQVLHNNANSAKKEVVPLRDSLLTRALANSFGGNSKAFVIVNMSPHKADLQDTTSTLEFSAIARKVVNVVRVNTDADSKLLAGMAEEIDRLKSLLADAEANRVMLSAREREVVTVVREVPAARVPCRDVSTQSDLDKPIRDALVTKLETTEKLFTDLESQVEAHAHTNVYLVEQIRHKDDAIVALQRQVEDAKKFFRRNVEDYFKDRKDVKKRISEIKAPLKKQAGCPQCQSHLTEVHVLNVQNATLKEELHVLTEHQEKIYLDLQHFKMKHTTTVAELAEMRNKLNVQEDKDLIIAEQKRRIEELSEQVAHNVQERAKLMTENFLMKEAQVASGYTVIEGQAGAKVAVKGKPLSRKGSVESVDGSSPN